MSDAVAIEAIQGTPGAKNPVPTSPLGYPISLLAAGETYESVTETIGSIVLTKSSREAGSSGFALAFALLMVFFAAFRGCFTAESASGASIFRSRGDLRSSNFVWWIGIGHAGTFISAILLLLHQKWRTSINRFTEAMTLFAVRAPECFPLLHLGRPWVFYWIFPYPDTMGLWPQFRSPLVWDVFAVSTYFTVSLIFWYVGLIPDLATVRDRANNTCASKSFMACWPWAGAVRRDTGSAINPPTCCSRDWRRRWCFRSTAS